MSETTDHSPDESMDASIAENRLTTAYDEHADAIFRHCYFRTGNRERGKELMQEVFMKTWEYMQKGSTIDNMRALLYKMANNLIIDEYRRDSKRKNSSLEDLQAVGFDIAADEDTTRSTEKLLNEQVVTAILSQLEEPYKTAVIMRYIDELSPTEIAESLGESTNIVSVRINRGLKKLQTLLPQNEQ